ncbi:MAG: hypothetical protein ACM3X6_07425 [Patescibacteria group bacterium]
MPASQDHAPPAEHNPGIRRQVKLHEMAVAYARILHRRIGAIAAEIAAAQNGGGLQALRNEAGLERRLRGFLAGTLHAVMTEQYEASASPFIATIRGAFQKGLDEVPVDGRESVSAPMVERLAKERLGGLIALVDLRAVEEVAEELLTRIFLWDGRRFTISAQRIEAAHELIARYGRALDSGGVPPGGGAIAGDALRLMLAVCSFRREPAPGYAAMLKECYVSAGHPPPTIRPTSWGRRGAAGVDIPGYTAMAAAPGQDDARNEIELFCRILGVWQEAAVEAGRDT